MSDFVMNFSESIYDIEAAVRKCGFPVVVKSENVCPEKKTYWDEEFYQNSQKLPRGSITMLERKVTIEFAHVTVMGYRDQNKVMSEKGEGYVEHHLELEDDDYLLPLTFDGKCKIIHPPGKRKRYVTVTQLIKDLPRWIRVNDQMVAVYSDSEDVHVIHAREIWEISGIKKVQSTKYLVCRNSEKQSVMISEDTPVNITAIDDTCTSLYTLKELTGTILLPKCVEFEYVSPDDIVIFDDFWASHILSMTGGPLKINAVVVKDFILGWCIPINAGGAKRSARTVLIPKSKWKEQKVKIRSFKNPTERMQYRKKHFPSPSDSEYLDHKLYLMEATDYPGIIWLQDRQPASEQPKPVYNPRDSRTSNVYRPPPLPLVTEELPESDIDEDYEEPIPRPEPGPPLPPKPVPLPERIPKPSDHWKTVLETIQRKSKSGFDKVHTEIRGLFRHKSTGDVPPPLYPRPMLKQRNLSEGCQSDQDEKDKHAKVNDKNKPKSKSKLQKSISLDSSTRQSETKGVTRSKSNASDTRKIEESPDFYLTPTEDNGEDIDVYYEGQVVREQETKDERNATASASVAKRPQLPLPTPPPACESKDLTGTANSDEESHDYDYPDEKEIRKLKKSYVGIDVMEVDRVPLDGQTAENFYDYSIEEVVRCFKMVGLPDMATKCEKEKINGKFFEGLSGEDIKEFFELEKLHFLKVKKAIFDGWRPS